MTGIITTLTLQITPIRPRVDHFLYLSICFSLEKADCCYLPTLFIIKSYSLQDKFVVNLKPKLLLTSEYLQQVHNGNVVSWNKFARWSSTANCYYLRLTAACNICIILVLTTLKNRATTAFFSILLFVYVVTKWASAENRFPFNRCSEPSASAFPQWRWSCFT